MDKQQTLSHAVTQLIAIKISKSEDRMRKLLTITLIPTSKTMRGPCTVDKVLL